MVERPVDRATIRTFPLLLYVSQSVSFVAGSPRAHHAWVTCGVDSIVYDRWRTKNMADFYSQLGERAMNGLFFFSDEATSSRSYVLRVETQDE